MTKEQLKSKVEELEKELAQFKKELDKADKSPYCENVLGRIYYCVNSNGKICENREDGSAYDQLVYKNANYFSDEPFAKKVAAEQTLTNLLRKYTYEHGWSDDLWENSSCEKYKIIYDNYTKKFESDCNKNYRLVDSIYFIDEETVANAIREVVIPFVKEHPELGYELKD